MLTRKQKLIQLLEQALVYANELTRILDERGRWLEANTER